MVRAVNPEPAMQFILLQREGTDLMLVSDIPDDELEPVFVIFLPEEEKLAA
jgi:hypothetical protein